MFRKRNSYDVIYSFNKYFFSAYCVPGTLLSAGDNVSKQKKGLYVCGS